MDNDVLAAEAILQAAFRTDVRPLLRESRLRTGGALDPIGVYRDSTARKQLIRERGDKTIATGL
jgi:L-rhamnose isomerase/sugar isomerase